MQRSNPAEIPAGNVTTWNAKKNLGEPVLPTPGTLEIFPLLVFFPSCLLSICDCFFVFQLPDGVQLTLSELREMACRQQAQIDSQHQLLAAKEQRLRYLKEQEARQQRVQAESERLRRLRDRVDAQELKLRKLRALRGQVDHQKQNNISLSESIFVSFFIDIFFSQPVIVMIDLGFILSPKRKADYAERFISIIGHAINHSVRVLK